MAKIIDINQEAIFVTEQGMYTKYKLELLDFSPRIGDSIIVFKNYDGTIAKISLDNLPKPNKLKIDTVKKTIGWYSIIFGSLAIIGQLSEEPDVFTLVLSILLIITGIGIFIKNPKDISHIAVMINFVLYCICIFSSLVVLFIIPLLGLLMFLLFGFPFAFGIVYLVKRKDSNS